MKRVTISRNAHNFLLALFGIIGMDVQSIKPTCFECSVFDKLNDSKVRDVLKLTGEHELDHVNPCGVREVTNYRGSVPLVWSYIMKSSSFVLAVDEKLKSIDYQGGKTLLFRFVTHTETEEVPNIDDSMK